MSKFTPEVRRPFYFLIAAILGVLPVFGIITAEQLDSWMEVLSELSPWIGTAALTIAGVKTNKGSDDPATQDDIIQAYKEAVPVYPVEGMEPVELKPVDAELGERPLTVAEAEAALAEARKNGWYDNGADLPAFPGMAGIVAGVEAEDYAEAAEEAHHIATRRE